MHILLVDDDKDSRASVKEFLLDIGHQITEAEDGQEAFALFQKSDYPMVLTDIKMPRMSGMELLRSLKSLPQSKYTDVVLFTGYGDMESAIEALRTGAYDYLLKPVNVNELAKVAERIAEHQALLRENTVLNERFAERVENATQETKKEIIRLKKVVSQYLNLNNIGVFSDKMRLLYQEAQQYHYDRSIPILIQGETGCGKEVIAKTIHFGNVNEVLPFIDINCAALTPSLFESELFGYEAGAFTGGQAKGSQGKLDLAEGGTLFLDEVGELPLELQGKLLRVIQEKEYYRVGGLKKIKADVRFICATNVDLEQKVAMGSFRKDLFYRLKVGHLFIPPLRERKEEIIPLATMFLQEFAQQKGKRFHTINDMAAKIILEYDWPGNVRELKNAMEWAVFMYDDTELKPAHLKKVPRETKTEPFPEENEKIILNPVEFQLPAKGFPLEEFNDRVILEALRMHKGNKTATALYLGISRRSLYSRLQNIKK